MSKRIHCPSNRVSMEAWYKILIVTLLFSWQRVILPQTTRGQIRQAKHKRLRQPLDPFFFFFFFFFFFPSQVRGEISHLARSLTFSSLPSLQCSSLDGEGTVLYSCGFFLCMSLLLMVRSKLRRERDSGMMRWKWVWASSSRGREGGCVSESGLPRPTVYR
ncbi:hypothetical protein QBC32DRAFT_44251 [Pseudoneurospora amorphoporcata]|uniref:Uncharacterized protein n=1 Tax=Pseudoneurospora amorphoporcata TaxID=241081 RepID=A0AAN6NNR9_9PEZI|nr:hypothetical protein QBC32DRAFT_44251 [Pseudoneurospora amorphoporcata]